MCVYRILYYIGREFQSREYMIDFEYRVYILYGESNRCEVCRYVCMSNLKLNIPFTTNRIFAIYIYTSLTGLVIMNVLKVLG